MIVLFAQYYQPKDLNRLDEVNECFTRNIENSQIDKVVILFEVEADMAIFKDSAKLDKLFFPKRVTYGDWLELTNSLKPGDISILANADIYFDATISYLRENAKGLFDNHIFIALTRYNLTHDGLVLSENPHWTQDSWIISRGKKPFVRGLLQETRFELGYPGCDNKIAYVMHSYGYIITNPPSKIRSVHLHAEVSRPYDSKGDKLIGLHAFVYPTDSLATPAKLEFDLLSRNAQDIAAIRVNNWINERRSYNFISDSPGNISHPDFKFKVLIAEPTIELMDKSINVDTANTINTKLNFEPHRRSTFIQKQDFDKLGANLIYRFNERFLLYFSNDNYYFLDKIWPGATAISSDVLGVFSPEKDALRFFIKGFIPTDLEVHPYEIGYQPKHKFDNLFWQFPCKTEQDAYIVHQSQQKNFEIGCKVWDVYIGLPWATFIDKETEPFALIGLITSRIRGAKNYLGNFGIQLKVHTVCQHIYWPKIMPTIKRFGVTDLWLSHKEKGVDVSMDVTLHAWALYAVNYREADRNEGFVYKPIQDRKLFASFTGAYMPHYISEVRKHLSVLKGLPGYEVVITDLWHFNKIVYNYQIAGDQAHKNAIDMSAVKTYNEMLSDSIFSLCPVGAGPNTLRLWESLAMGSIPVNLSDTYEFPDLKRLPIELNIKWEDVIVFHPEKDISTLDQKLRSIPKTKLNQMQRDGKRLFEALLKYNCIGVKVKPLPLTVGVGEQVNLQPLTVSDEIGRVVDDDNNKANLVKITLPTHVLEKFKPQQLHVLGDTASVFDGNADFIKASFHITEQWTEVLIHFDQTESVVGVIFSAELSPKEQLEVEIFNSQKDNKFNLLLPPIIIETNGAQTVNFDTSDPNFSIAMKFRMRVLKGKKARLSLAPVVATSLFSHKVKLLNACGYLKFLSETNQIRKDDLFDTEHIESGKLILELPGLVKNTPLASSFKGALFNDSALALRNYIGEPLKEGVTMYIHLMNRNENVRENSANWLAQKFDELILLDWSSEEAVATIPGIFNDPRVRVIRVINETTFIRSWAQNLASKMARYKTIFKCDSDVIFKGDFFAHHKVQKGEFFAGDWHQARDFNERHIHGETFYHIDDFMTVNGYDERILSYGQDDTNLKDRMVLAGLIKKVFSYNQIYHVPHDNALRTSNQDMVHPMVNTIYHRMFVNECSIWAANSTDSVSFNCLENEDNYVEFIVSKRIVPPSDAVLLNRSIDKVALWYADHNKFPAMTREEKIKLIWEKCVE